MPTVKTYQRQIVPEKAPLVQRQQYAIPHLETPAPQVPKTGALEGAARFGEQVGNIGASLFAQEQQKQDQMRLLDAHSQAAQLEYALLYDPKSGAFNVRGKDALGLPDTVSKSWDDQTGKIRQGLSNDRQRMAFDEFNVNRRASVMESLSRHVAQESYNLDTQTVEGLVENETQAGIADPHPARVEQSVTSITQAYQAYGEQYKQPKDVTDAAIAKAKGRIYAGKIERYLDNNEDIKAKVFYEQHQNDILGSDRGKIEAAIHQSSTLGEGQRNSDMIVHGGAIGQIAQPTLKPKDIYERPILNNDTGKVLPFGSDVTNMNYSTTLSESFNAEDLGVGDKYGKDAEVLIPTVVNGKKLTDDEAIAQFKKTGEHLGVFDTPDHADMAATHLHNRQDRYARGQGNEPTLTEQLDQASQIQDPRVRQATEEQIRTRNTAQRQDARLRAQEAALDAKERMDQMETQVKNSMDRANKNLTYEQVVPQSVRDRLSEAVEKGQREYWKLITEQKEPKTDPGTFYNLYSLATADATKDKFAQTNLMQYLPKLSRSDFDKLVELQGSIRKGDDKKTDSLSEGFRSVNEMAEDSLGLALGHKPLTTDKDEYRQLTTLHQLVDQDMQDFEQRTKKKPTKPEIQGFIDQHLIKGTTTTPGWIWNSQEQKPSMDVPQDQPFSINFPQIPKDEVRKIEQALSRAGLPESESIITEMYLRKIRGQKKAITQP